MTGHIGQAGTEGARQTHESRHNAPDLKTVDRIERLFDSRPSGFGLRNRFEAYEAAERAGILIKPTPISKSVLKNANRTSARDYSRSKGEGGLCHCWLKEIGIKWLAHTMGAVAKREWQNLGHRYDLAAPDRGIVFECGNTNVYGAIRALEGGLTYYLLPFSNAADLWFEREGEPHVFLFQILPTIDFDAERGLRRKELTMSLMAKMGWAIA
jgi:hypothetical protein